MNTIQAALLVITLALVGAIGYIFYLVGGLFAGGLFVALSLGSAYGVQYFFGGRSSSSSGGARQGRQSKGARQREE